MHCEPLGEGGAAICGRTLRHVSPPTHILPLPSPVPPPPPPRSLEAPLLSPLRAAQGGAADAIAARLFPKARHREGGGGGGTARGGTDPLPCPVSTPPLPSPQVLLLHGTRDTTVPHTQSEDFGASLRLAGVDAEVRLYECVGGARGGGRRPDRCSSPLLSLCPPPPFPPRGKTHTMPLIEDPMRGGRDPLVEDILDFVRGGGGSAKPDDRDGGAFSWSDIYQSLPLCPKVFIDLAAAICPF